MPKKIFSRREFVAGGAAAGLAGPSLRTLAAAPQVLLPGVKPIVVASGNGNRSRELTIQKRLLNERGEPNFGISFYVVNAKGEYAGVTLSNPNGRSTFAVCTENGPQNIPLEPLLS